MAEQKSNGRIEIYDTTLRDGMQMEGIAFSLEDKLLIAKKLDELGVDYIEGGYPLSNQKDISFFREIRKAKLKNSRVTAFGMTRKKGVRAADDAGMIALQKSLAPTITLVAKGWDFQVQKVINTSLDENLRMICDSVLFLRKKRREVLVDIEHFFDGYKQNPTYALRCVEVAAEAGARCVILCDTNGGTLDTELEEIFSIVHSDVGVPLGVHTHDDSGVGVAAALAGVRAGAIQVQGTINGIGERVGNANLCSIIPNLVLKMGYSCLQKNSLQKLTEVSRYVYETANMSLPHSQPYVGTSAFTHKGGMHVHAVQKLTRCYEHIHPEAVGNTRKILISELSGASNLLAKSEKLAMVKDKSLVRKILNDVQNLENEGYQFETAEGSFDLLVRRHMGHYRKFFEMDHYRTVNLVYDGRTPITEATVKLKIKNKFEHHVAEGDGPVNALDAALRQALEVHYPHINEMQLVDYKVRVVNTKEGTASKVRVIIESRDDKEYWGTIGVSENIIEASWKALVDSFEYKLLKH